MIDDRLQRLLRAADETMTPAPEFAAGLLVDLRAELGFAVAAGSTAPVRVWERVGRGRTRGRQSRLVELLLVAALLAATALGIAIASGALRIDLTALDGDALARIQSLGRIRIAIRPDHPQFSTAGQPAAGFDADVARALAGHMGLPGTVVIVPAAAMIGDRSATVWDVGLPSVAPWRINSSQFELSSAYYWWPHRVLVSDDSLAAGLTDLTGASVCAVTGDVGEAWLATGEGPSRATPISVTILSLPTDDDCLAALATGSVSAVVTSRLSDADIAVRTGIRILDAGPDPEGRVVIVPRRGTVDGRSPLVDAIDAALRSMFADGTLAQLSQNRFGGADLTEP